MDMHGGHLEVGRLEPGEMLLERGRAIPFLTEVPALELIAFLVGDGIAVDLLEAVPQRLVEGKEAAVGTASRSARMKTPDGSTIDRTHSNTARCWSWTRL